MESNEEIATGTNQFINRREPFDDDIGNGEVGPSDISRTEEDLDGIQQTNEFSVVTLESFASDDGPQHVDDGNAESTFKINNPLWIRGGTGAQITQQLMDFFLENVLWWSPTETQIPQMAQCETTLLLPIWSIEEHDT